MDPAAPLFVWVLSISALSVSALLIVVAAVVAWNQRRTLRLTREWSHRLLVAQETERARIAHDLHDDVVQRLWSARLAAQAGHSEEAESTLDAVASDLRSLAHDLHPPALRHLHLGEALKDLAARHFIPGVVEVDVDVPDEVVLEAATALTLYRVAQEALTNITKHAEATHVRLTLRVTPDKVRLEIQDDGMGMVKADLRHSFGLRSMHERLQMVGGAIRFSSPVGGGTTLYATAPAP